MRQTRADSAAAAVQAAHNAAQAPLTPPDHLAVCADARPFWDALMRSRPRHRWTDADMATAAMLARAYRDVERHEAAIDAEGDMVDGKLNPRLGHVDKLGRRIAMMSRLLHVHPEATQGRAREQGNELATEREAEAQHDPLIPTLRAVS